MNAETIQTMLEESREEIRAAALAAVKERVAEQIGYRMHERISEAVDKFMIEEIVPEVGKMLVDEKAGILAAIEPGIAAIGADVAKAMQKAATEALTTYKGREILTKLMGAY